MNDMETNTNGIIMNNGINIITAETGYTNVSERYRPVPTAPLAEKFKSLGFTVDSFTRRGCRNVNKVPFVKHQVRLSHSELLKNEGNRDIKLQLLISNSFDGTSALKMMLGFFRLVCSNGLVVGTSYEHFSHRHVGNIIEEVDSSIERIVAQTDRLLFDVDKMKSKTLNVIDARDFLIAAAKIKDEKIQEALFEPRREADTALDIFTLYNVAQEGIIRGNTEFITETGERKTMRRLRNLDEIERINRELFDLALQFANAA